ncbi:MAG TPA: DUF1569 domain-containing protein [Thermoanaerobaculia bacterium]|nr:DUF1569 domain-containing protein [Thermoanaerobaculia bacterium]
MGNLFDSPDRDSILGRIAKLRPDSPRQWGRMQCAQMLAHCKAALEAGTGDKPRKQVWIGKIVSPFVRRGLLSDRKPFPRNSPTDPAFVVSTEKDLEIERLRLTELIHRFCELGRDNAGRQTHSFFGRMSGDEWGFTMYKHLDHHLRQFGA